MKLAELKAQVYECWRDLSEFQSAIVEPDRFKPEVRRFGDLRRKITWEKAYAAFKAKNCYDACLDAWTLIRYSFNFTPDRWDYPYRHQVIEAFLTLPEGLDLIKLGLEQLLSAPFTTQDRKDASGFFELVQEQPGRIGLPVGSVRQLASPHPARAS